MMLGEAPTVLQRRVSFCIPISTRVVADATLKQSHQQLVINGVEVTLYVDVYYPPTLQHHIGHPIALVACYVAPWQLPRPDLPVSR
jgi:hypothetical protein